MKDYIHDWINHLSIKRAIAAPRFNARNSKTSVKISRAGFLWRRMPRVPFCFPRFSCNLINWKLKEITAHLHLAPLNPSSLIPSSSLPLLYHPSITNLPSHVDMYTFPLSKVGVENLHPLIANVLKGVNVPPEGTASYVRSCPFKLSYIQSTPLP